MISRSMSERATSRTIIAVDHDLDAAAFAAIPEQHDRVATSRSHAAIVPISRGQRKTLFYVQGGGKRRDFTSLRYSSFRVDRDHVVDRRVC